MLRTFKSKDIQNDLYFSYGEKDVVISEDNRVIYTYPVIFGVRVCGIIYGSYTKTIDICCGNNHEYLHFIYNWLICYWSHNTDTNVSAIYNEFMGKPKPHYNNLELTKKLAKTISRYPHQIFSVSSIYDIRKHILNPVSNENNI